MTAKERVLKRYPICPSCDEYAMPEAWLKLESDRARLIDLANRATNMRPALLMTLGYVPEPVLEYCNDVRAVLAELKEPK